MADEAQARPLTGSPPGRLKLGGLRALRGGRDLGHDFNDSKLEGRMKRECRRIYTRAFGAISDSDWDAAFNFAYGQAWKVEREKGSIDSLTSWLTTAAHNAVVSEHRKTGRVDLLATEEFFTQPAGTDLADTIEDRQLLRDAIFCLKSTLPERARLVWTMRFAGDYEPGEIQRHLSISKKAYEKDLELASRLIVDRLGAARKSGVCDTPDMTSMVRAYAIWGEEHGAERARLAREHLDRCPACRRTVRALRSAQRAAAFLPPPILGLTSQHSPPLSVVMQATERVAARIQDGLWRLTDRVQDGLLRMKYGLMKLVSRGPASGPVGADRTATVLGAGGTSGAAIATKAVVGCLAAGVLAGGTGACLKAAGVGVPGLNGLIHSITGSPHRRVHEPPSPHYVVSTATQSLGSMASWTVTQGLSRPARPSRPPSGQFRVERKATRRSPSAAMVARSEFGSPPSSTPRASPAEVSAARDDFSSSPSHLARAASSEGTGAPAQSSPPSELHTNKASTKAAENEFEGP